MSLTGPWTRGLAFAALLAGTLAGGYILGSGQATSEADAQAEQRAAAATAFDAAYADALAASQERGLAEGKDEGRAAGDKLGALQGDRAGKAEVELRAAEAAAAAAEADAAEEPVVICDGAIADDAHYAACLEQSGQAIPPGFPGGPAGCPMVPPFPVEGPCADVRP